MLSSDTKENEKDEKNKWKTFQMEIQLIEVKMKNYSPRRYKFFLWIHFALSLWVAVEDSQKNCSKITPMNFSQA